MVALKDMKLSLTSSIEEMDRIYPWITELSAAYQIPDATLNQINLCLEEMVLNTIRYGYPDQPETDPSGHITVEVDWADNCATIIIEDDAVAFNPLDYEIAEHPTRLADAHVGGLGIELIRNFSDSMDYQRLNDRNQLTVVISAASE